MISHTVFIAVYEDLQDNMIANQFTNADVVSLHCSALANAVADCDSCAEAEAASRVILTTLEGAIQLIMEHTYA